MGNVEEELENVKPKPQWSFDGAVSGRVMLKKEGEDSIGRMLGYMLEYPEYKTVIEALKAYVASGGRVRLSTIVELARLMDGNQLSCLHALGKIDPVAIRALLKEFEVLELHSSAALLDDEEFEDDRCMTEADRLRRNAKHVLLPAMIPESLHGPPADKLQEKVADPADRSFLLRELRKAALNERKGTFNASRFKYIMKSLYDVDFNVRGDFSYVLWKDVDRTFKADANGFAVLKPVVEASGEAPPVPEAQGNGNSDHGDETPKEAPPPPDPEPPPAPVEPEPEPERELPVIEPDPEFEPRDPFADAPERWLVASKAKAYKGLVLAMERLERHPDWPFRGLLPVQVIREVYRRLWQSFKQYPYIMRKEGLHENVDDETMQQVDRLVPLRITGDYSAGTFTEQDVDSWFKKIDIPQIAAQIRERGKCNAYLVQKDGAVEEPTPIPTPHVEEPAGEEPAPPPVLAEEDVEVIEEDNEPTSPPEAKTQEYVVLPFTENETGVDAKELKSFFAEALRDNDARPYRALLGALPEEIVLKLAALGVQQKIREIRSVIKEQWDGAEEQLAELRRATQVATTVRDEALHADSALRQLLFGNNTNRDE